MSECLSNLSQLTFLSLLGSGSTIETQLFSLFFLILTCSYCAQKADGESMEITANLPKETVYWTQRPAAPHNAHLPQ